MVGKRGFDIDIEPCPHSCGQLKLIAAIEEPAATARTGGAAATVSGGVRSESGLDFERAGRGVRPEHTQTRGKDDKESTDFGRFQENGEFSADR